MIVAKVVGNVWATRKHPDLEGKKLLLISQIDELSGHTTGKTQLAIDNASAGIGDTVLIIDEGSSCRLIIGTDHGPTRTVIVGIVDQISKNGKVKKYH